MIQREDKGRVRVLLFNRPPSNTLNMAFLDAIIAEIDQAGKDSAIQSVLISSTTPKYFSSGLDLEEMLSFPANERSQIFERMATAHRKIAALPKPTIAAIEGYSLLGGFVLALACDWRLLSESGKVALSEVRLGISPGPLLIRLVFALSGQPGLIKQLVLQGKTLKSEEALAAGLVDKLLPAEGFMENALREAERLTKIAPAAYASIKKTARAALVPHEDELWQQSAREFEQMLAGEEAQEGLRAMKEKRKPRWE